MRWRTMPSNEPGVMTAWCCLRQGIAAVAKCPAQVEYLSAQRRVDPMGLLFSSRMAALVPSARALTKQ